MRLEKRGKLGVTETVACTQKDGSPQVHREVGVDQRELQTAGGMDLWYSWKYPGCV